MDLIKKLGGYEKAKNEMNYLNDSEYAVDHCYAHEIGQALLDYRREHNIFEVGDYYAYLYEWDSDLDIVCKYNPSEWSDHLWNIKNMIRHATDEEIKAGHRL